MKTIFDIGMHDGSDTEFYLKKGFRVVGVEANPRLSDVVRQRFVNEIAEGRLVVINKALAERGGQTTAFYVRADSDGWSSIHRQAAERDGIASNQIEIETATMGELFAEFGVPYFLKCDVEGAESLILDQLCREFHKPQFISVESVGDELIDLLVAASYARFQIINQGCLRLFKPPRPAREGNYVSQRFHGRTSGLFGEELSPKHWTGEREVRRRLALWQRLHGGHIDPVRKLALKKVGKWTRRTWLINTGWIDIHARLDG